MDGSPKLLVVDDEPQLLTAIERSAEELGFSVEQVDSGRQALAELREAKADLALVDLQTAAVGGLDVLREIRSLDPDCRVALMTGHADGDAAIEAVKLGALDYLTKPLDFDRLRELLFTVKKIIERREQLLSVDAEVARRFEFHGMVGRSPAMQELFDTIRRLAPHVRTVLVSGEPGTGKELVARALHDVGPRRGRPIVTVNCSAVVPSLFESELFGHVRGAFSGAVEPKIGVLEHSDRGTLFLDEIGELPLSLQPKLLRAVEHGEVRCVGSHESRKVDVTLIAATNRDLRSESAAGRFCSDLYDRLYTIEIHLPPLRKRREDIPCLTAAFVRECAQRLNRTVSGVTSAAERILQQGTWPGNIRELRSVIERACLLTEGRMLTERDVLAAMSPKSLAPSAPQPDHLLSTVQRDQIERVLRQVNGNKSEAARLLGVSRRSLYRKLDRFGGR